MRLFVAIRFSPAVEQALWAAVGDLRRQGDGTFTRRENLHLTLAFIGETDRLEEVKSALAPLTGSGPVCLEAGGPLAGLGICGGPASGADRRWPPWPAPSRLLCGRRALPSSAGPGSPT